MFKRGLVGYLPANILQGIIGFLSVYAYSRLLTPDQFGAYAIAFGIASVIHTAVFTWVEAAMARFVVTEAAGSASLAAHVSTLWRTGFGLILAFAIVTFIVGLIWPGTQMIRFAVLAALAASPFRHLAKLVLERRRSEGRVVACAGLDMFQTAGGFLAGAALARLGLGPAAPFLGVAIFSGLGVIAFGRSDLAEVWSGAFAPERLKAYAAYGAPVAASLILSVGLFAMDRILIGAMLSGADAGAYHAAYSLSSRTLDVLFIWLGAASGPALLLAFERTGVEGLKAAAARQVETFLSLGLPAAVGLALVARPLAEVMLGEGLRAAAALVTPWIAAAGLLSGLTTYYLHQAFTVSRRTGRLALVMTIALAANLGLNLSLIPLFGLTGAAVAAVGGFGVGFIASAWLGRSSGIALPLPAGPIGRIAAACAVMAATVVALPALGGLAELALKAAAGGLAYAASAIVLNVHGLRRELQTRLARRTAGAAPL